jgi:acyl-CoA thioester hydrolase
MSQAVFRRTRVVRQEDADALGHVNNVAWVRFVVELADAHSRAVGLGRSTYGKLGGLWIVRRHEIEYARAALPGEEIVEETWLERMKGARSIRRSLFTRAEDGATLVEATTHWAWVDSRTQRPKRIDPEVLDRFRASGAAGEPGIDAG